MKHLLPNIRLDLKDFLLIALMSVPAFYHLGTPAIYIWDEAVYANAALDMSTGGSWWVPVHGEYNTKPPFVLWLQALMLLLLPSPEWAVRLPSALAVTGILFLFSAALKRWGFDRLTRILVMVCFVAHEGFIRHHISRTGDLDAVMVFFVTAYCMVFLDAHHQQRWSGKHSFFFFASLLLAFFSKSIAGWMMMAPLGILWLLSPLRVVLLRRSFWWMTLLTAGWCSFYYVSREWVAPGFLKNVWGSEYLRMAHNVMPWHEHGFSFYFNNFIDLKYFYPWFYLLLIAIPMGLLLIKERGIRTSIAQWSILGLGYILLISYPPVKLEWYDAPAYPFFAMITGVVLAYFIRHWLKSFAFWLCIPLIFWVMIRKMEFIRRDVLPRHPFEQEGSILQKMETVSGLKVFMPVQTKEHQLQAKFYQRIKEMKSGMAIPIVDSADQIDVGDRVIVSQMDQWTKISDRLISDTLKIWPGLGYEMVILEKKSKQ